jgi:hypothetical protein
MLYVITITIRSYMDEVMGRKGEVKKLVFTNNYEALAVYKALKGLDYIYETDKEVTVKLTVTH